MFQSSTLHFLRQLARNNHKEWFDRHRADYESAKADFSKFIDSMILRHGSKDPGIAGLQAKECTFRINRDIRFSKNKTPYKKNLAASINRGGKKSIFAGYYFHLQPGESFVGGGIWMPAPVELGKIRQEIDYGLEEFRAILTNKRFRAIYGTLDMDPEYKLIRPPKNYDEDNPAIEYLKLKSYIAIAPVSDDILTSPELIKTVLAAFAAIQPLLDFINRAIEE